MSKPHPNLEGKSQSKLVPTSQNAHYYLPYCCSVLINLLMAGGCGRVVSWGGAGQATPALAEFSQVWKLLVYLLCHNQQHTYPLTLRMHHIKRCLLGVTVNGSLLFYLLLWGCGINLPRGHYFLNRLSWAFALKQWPTKLPTVQNARRVNLLTNSITEMVKWHALILWINLIVTACVMNSKIGCVLAICNIWGLQLSASRL